jgi:hypothetical protein
MRKFAALSLLLAGCSYQQPASNNQTVPRHQIRLPENERSIVVERSAEINRRLISGGRNQTFTH